MYDQVTKVDPNTQHIYYIRDMLHDARSELRVHAERLMLYTHIYDGISHEMREQWLHDRGTYVVQKVLNRKLTDGVWHLHIKWLGFDDAEATWEPLTALDGARQVVTDYTAELRRTGAPADVADADAIDRVLNPPTVAAARIVVTQPAVLSAPRPPTVAAARIVVTQPAVLPAPRPPTVAAARVVVTHPARRQRPTVNR